MSDEADLVSRNIVVHASGDGITVRISGAHETRPWSSVSGVGATIVPHGPGPMFVLVIEFDDACVLTIGECKAAWSGLTDLLHVCLPGVEAFADWGPRLLEKPAAIELYMRM